MSRSTVLEATDAGPAVVVRASDADAPVLRRTGERLLAAAHPGVVEVLSSTGSEDHWELRTLHAGRPLDTLERVDVEVLAGLVAATATTLADLHANGITHGRIDASHVLVGPHGRPILCGFAVAGDASPVDDVAALGSLIVALVGQDCGEPLPERRWRRQSSRELWTRRSLLLLADQCGAEPPSRRPTAARLAAAIAESCGVDVPARQQSPAPRGASPAGRTTALVWAVLAVVVLGAAGARLAPGRDLTARPAGSRTASTVVASTVVASTAVDPVEEIPPTTDVSAGPPLRCLPPPGEPEGCAAVEVAGRSVRLENRRYEVGEDGDLVVLGDWDCDGVLTPALLRPASGDLFVFDAWATDADEQVVVTALQRVPGGSDLQVERGADGCADLVVRRADGSTQRVEGASTQ